MLQRALKHWLNLLEYFAPCAWQRGRSNIVSNRLAAGLHYCG
jgi:hypothetical protein